MKFFIAFLASIILCSFAWQSNYHSDIIVRHDINEQAYFDLGEQYQYSICNLHLNPNIPDGMATFIAPKWLLTAAHCAIEIEEKLEKQQSHAIVFHKDTLEVEKVILYPDYKTDQAFDLALVKLKSAPDSVVVIPLYQDTLEKGKNIIVAGYGDKGNGKEGILGNDKKLRAGTNRIDAAIDNWLVWMFDAPESENVTPLEAISGPGDSGGPAFIQENGQDFLAGISVGQDTDATDGVEGVYGVTEYYVRVSSFKEWITKHTN